MIKYLFLLLLAFNVDASERFYNYLFCKHGKTEVVLKDRTRVDCLTKQHAIEVDWANKWPEAIGQSLHYAKSTGKKAGVVLLFKKPGDLRYWKRMNDIIWYYSLPINTWRVNAYTDRR